MEDYVNPRVTNAVATNTTLSTTVATNSPKRVLKLPRPPEHPDGPGTVDIEVTNSPIKLRRLLFSG